MLKTAVDLLNELDKLEPNSENLIVGGAVRDLLLGEQPHDIDLATNINIDKIQQHFKTADIGKSKDFGITQVQYNGETFEVAHFREDGSYSDSRRPDSVKSIKSFAGDASRRDLTINALGIDKNGVIHDYVGGIDDLKNKLIRTVGEPFKRFTEDALRLMRIGRFSAKLGFKIEPATLKAMTELKDLITKVTSERIRGELFKMAGVSGSAIASYIEHLQETGILELILPEISQLINKPHSQKFHPESPHVFGHIMSALRHSRSKVPIVNMAILFHDVGKLVTQGVNDEGLPSYHGHEGDDGIAVFENIANRLKFSTAEKLAIEFAIKYHMLADNFQNMKKSKVVAMRQSPYWNILSEVMYTDNVSRGKAADVNDYNKEMQYVEDLFAKFGEKDAFEQRMKNFVDGRMVMELRPDAKTTDIGVIKNAARDFVIQKDFQVSPEEVKEFIKNYEVV